jgi:hypothetical protein
MKNIIHLSGILAAALALAPLYGASSPIPTSLLGTDYVTFGSNSFNNLIGPFPAGYGGAFDATIYGNPTSPTGPAVTTTVWCVDYQLDVEVGSDYTADIVSLANATSDAAQVRYGTLPSDGSSWANTLTPTNNYGYDPNSALYRYTLAAALISEYEDSSNQIDPTNPANTSQNQAIQTAIWYLTYNNEYNPGATWAPFDPTQYGASNGNINSPGDYLYWVNWAENNVTSVDLNDWAIVSGPADASGNLLPPNGVNGYQTFLVQVQPTPEPTFFALLAVGLLGLAVVARKRRAQLAAASVR